MMSDNKFSLINFEGASDVVIKFLDMISNAIGWVVTPHGSRQDFEEGIAVYKSEIASDSSLSPIQKAAKITAARKEIKEYINQTKIISYAIQDINSNSKLNVDNDWLTYFFDYAKNISDEMIQAIWGRILAERCKGDTSINRQLIHILSLLDADTANAFVNLSRLTFKYPKKSAYEHMGTKFLSEYVPFIISSRIYGLLLTFPKNTPNHKSALEYAECIPKPSEIGILEEIGLVELSEKTNNEFTYPFKFGLVNHDYSGKGNKYQKTTVGEYVVEYYGHKYIIKPQEKTNTPEELPEYIRFGLVKYTTVGEKMFSIINAEPIKGFELVFKHYLQGQNYEIKKQK